MLGKQGAEGADSHGGKRSQAALEYLITYSWAILLLVILVAFLYFYVFVPRSITPSSCTFSSAVYCDDIVVGTNATSHATMLSLLLTNTQPYPIENPSMMVSTSGSNTTKVQCEPSFVTAGGTMICQTALPQKTDIGAFVAGNIYFSASYCALASNSSSPSSCSTVPEQTYLGGFSSHAQAALGPSVTVSLTGSPANPAYTTTAVTLYATVKLLGYPLKGATVNFTENPTTPSLSPEFSTTNPLGVAHSYLSSNVPITVNVTAAFAGHTASYIVSFTAPPSTTSTTATSTTSTSTTTTIISVQPVAEFGNLSTDQIILHPFLASSSSVTLTGWIYWQPGFNLAGGSGDYGYAWGGVGGSPSNTFGLYLNSLDWNFKGGSAPELSCTTPAPSTGVWYMFTMTWNAVTSNEVIFVNGAAQCSRTEANVITANTFYLGGASGTWGGIDHVMGPGTLLSDVQIYGSALTPSQVQALYNSGYEAAPSSGAVLDAWFPLNGTANDYTAPGVLGSYPGTISGNVVFTTNYPVP